MPEELRVESTHDESASGQRGACPRVAQPRESPRDEVGGMLARERQRAVVPVRSAIVAPRIVVVNRVVVVIAVGTARRVAGVAPHQRDGRAVDRDEHDSRVAGKGSQVLARAEAEAVGQLDAHGCYAGILELAQQRWGVGALGKPEAAPPAAAEAPPVRAHAALHLHAHAGVRSQQRQDRVGRRGGPLGVGGERAEQLVPAALEALERHHILTPRAIELGGEPVMAAGPQAGRVLFVGLAARALDELA